MTPQTLIFVDQSADPIQTGALLERVLGQDVFGVFCSTDRAAIQAWIKIQPRVAKPNLQWAKLTARGSGMDFISNLHKPSMEPKLPPSIVLISHADALDDLKTVWTEGCIRPGDGLVRLER